MTPTLAAKQNNPWLTPRWQLWRWRDQIRQCLHPVTGSCCHLAASWRSSQSSIDDATVRVAAGLSTVQDYDIGIIMHGPWTLVGIPAFMMSFFVLAITTETNWWHACIICRWNLDLFSYRYSGTHHKITSLLFYIWCLKVGIESGKANRALGLARWNHPSFGKTAMQTR